MNELICISTDAQGASVVSARELHGFLDVRKDFSNWIKHRIQKYGLVENQDYVVFAQIGENPQGGRPQIDYVLTLDAAKELAMVEGNAKGKQARQYFIDAEKALRQVTDTLLTAPPTTEQVLIQLVSQQNQLMAATQEFLSRLRAEVDEIRAGQRPTKGFRSSPRRIGQQLDLPGIPAPTPSLRPLINRKIDEYCDRSGYDRRDTWNYLYKRLFQVYGIDAHRLQRIGTESLLDAIERYGHLDRLYALIMAELTYTEE